ncbi:MAG: ATP-dependent 6-phosphofructokinase [Phycisphaeraceae bacterium]|nr:ATP-dependent 6-phosphofructokinase [Phycisphaeraceae bacterium]
MVRLEMDDFVIRDLGSCLYDSPLADLAMHRAHTPRFVDDDERLLLHNHLGRIHDTGGLDAQPTLEIAGPRRNIFFNPAETTVGIVTCGGLCPGLNDVIRGLVMESWYRYGIRNILGFRFGYKGLVPDSDFAPIKLDPELVSEIHEQGGSMLGSSRGPQDTSDIADRLAELGVNILFVIGGDGTLRGGLDISRELHKRNAPISLIGVPKTIDNDLLWIDRSFGFDTAYTEAVNAIISAHNEARGTYNGIGLVKLMGRHSGFIAAHATLATSHVNFCLIPEMPLLPTSNLAFFDALRERLQRRHHAVIVVAEGAFQDQIKMAQQAQDSTDASGNTKLLDVGTFLAERIGNYMSELGIEHSLKYIDPSYIIRSVPATPSDSVYCWRLAQNAVHAAMAGKTEMVVGRRHGSMVHMPIAAVTAGRNRVDPESDIWLSVLETTGQPAVFA